MLKRTKIIGGVAALVVAASVTSAVAAIPDSDDGEIHGCRQPVTGNLRVVDDQAGASCHGSELQITWNQQGVAGPIGPQGPPGPPGASVSFRRVASSPLSALAGTHVEYDVACEVDEKETGGGWDTGGYPDVEATSSRPGTLTGAPGWRVNIKNSSTTNRFIHVFVVCAK